MKRILICTVFALLFALLSGSMACAGAIFDDILKKGELVVGISGDQPPLNATTKDGMIIGLDADLASAIATHLNLKIRFSKMPFSELLQAVQSGNVDMVISGMTITPERKTKVAFVGPYFTSGKGLLIKKSKLDILNSKDGINSKKVKVATLKGSTSQEVIEKVTPKATLVLAGSYDEALDMLDQDKVDTLVADYPYCAYIANRYPGKKLTLWETKLSIEPLGIAVREDAQFIHALDNFLKSQVESGKMDTLRDKWFIDLEWIKQLP